MRKGFEWFEGRLQRQVRQEPDPGMALAQLVETISDKLFFTVITVADELNAYKVFETLNARGVRLPATDLLKNYLFSVLARQPQLQPAMDQLERRWESIIRRLGRESFPDLLRMHWNSRQGFTRQSDLFKAVRRGITSSAEVFALLRAIDEDIDTYLALTQPDGSTWALDAQRSAWELRMFSVRQPYPMLMLAYRRLSLKEFNSLLQAVVVISFRYNVIGAQRSSEHERLYHQVAVQLHRGELQSLAELLPVLQPIYRSDQAFRADFKEKSINTGQSRNAKVVRYILAALERDAGGVEIDPTATGFNIEHISPQAPDAGWDAFSERDQEAFMHRLGDLVLLETSLNGDLANRPYAENVQRSRPVPSPAHARWRSSTTTGHPIPSPSGKLRWLGVPRASGASLNSAELRSRLRGFRPALIQAQSPQSRYANAWEVLIVNLLCLYAHKASLLGACVRGGIGFEGSA